MTGLTDAVIVDAVRTPIGRRDGALSTVKPVALLRHVLLGLIERTGVDPAAVEQVIGGCVSQVGEQGLGVTRNAWLATGLDPGVGCTTVDVSCGSAQQANHLVAALIATGAIEVGIACGVESMSRVPAGANAPGGVDEHKLPDYPWDDPPGVQFGGAERIARREGLTRADLDGYGALSQQRAARAWAHGRYAAEVLPLGGLARDEGLRPTTVETLAGLRPVMRGGLHTAGSTSQVSDGAAAVLWMSRRRADELGLRPRARLLHQVVTGADPYFLLDGPTVATRRILDRARLKLTDLDVVEVNEAFAAVVLSWARHHGADLDRVNVNGGAIALGHPMGATGARLLTTALHELERIDGELALVTMCCGGSQGTASVLQRIAG
ncbi:acetyl-CoA C-acetyltransferase [Micromonospora echinaurantiaca]|uniref:Acetyl-CoA C-acetyltransferase n=1 Tax=Micromonospora echinaurantiaca TaxID=47857 RepID=A0A1C5HLA7_9ACTN|nr:acetyl-CoA C-acetyltransferase [Micromonospora echinaurantiaca]